MSAIGYFWTPGVYMSHINEWIKIEFKIPQGLSNIKILHTWHPSHGFKTCNCDIEYEDGNMSTYKYTSNGELSTFAISDYLGRGGDQKIVDNMFDSIDFNKTFLAYNAKIGYVETLDTNNFRNIPIDKFEKIKVLYANPNNTFLSCLISFDQKQTWKTFNGTTWNTFSDISPDNIILNGMEVSNLNKLDKNKLISGGFTGNLDFKIAMKTNDVNKTPSVTKIYVEYK